MFKRFLRKLKSIFGLDFYDLQPIQVFSLSYFYKPSSMDNGIKLYGKKAGHGFKALRKFALVPDALGMSCDVNQMFIIHIQTDHARTRAGRRMLREWFIKNGLEREYIDDGIVQFHPED